MKKRLHVSILSCALAVMLSTLLIGGPAVAAPATPLACGAWSVVSSPSIASSNAFLNGVAAVSSTNAWAVGYISGPQTAIGGNQTLIENWNGQQWSIVSSPHPGDGSILNAVTSVPGTSQLWAVGNYFTPTFGQTLAAFWNGSTWQLVSSPNIPSAANSLNGVAALSANDVWAVGNYYNGSITLTLIEHWNGTQWSIVTSPSPGPSFNILYGVAAVSSTNVWAVGAYEGNSGEQSLIEHWNGHKWSVVANPGGTVLGGITAVAGTNELWAVGPNLGSPGVPTLVEHWNGSTWSIVPSPNPGAGFNALPAVTALAANDVWAVGFYSNGKIPVLTLIEHWDGSSWTVFPSPNPNSPANYLNAVAPVPGASQLWAVGLYAAGQFNQPLIEFYC